MALSRQKVIAIVDPYSTGAKYAAEYLKQFKQNPDKFKDYKLILIQSQPTPPTIFQPTHDALVASGQFAEVFACAEPTDAKKDIEGLVQAVLDKVTEKYDVMDIHAGTESGVNFAETAAHLLGLPGNAVDKTLAHRNKHDMHNVLKASGMHTMPDYLSSDVEKIIAFANSIPAYVEGVHPVVLKPKDDAATNGVYFCHNEQEIREGFKNVLKCQHTFGQENTDVLAQTYLHGEEFMVNFVARTVNGVTHRCFIDICDERKDKLIYQDEVSLQRDDPRFKPLCNYVSKAADKLGITDGAGHFEVKGYWNAQGEFVITLIEGATRLPGGTDLETYRQLYHFDPVEIDVLARLYPEKFPAFVAEYERRLLEDIKDKPESERVYMWNLYTRSYVEGTVTRPFFTEADLKRLFPSLIGHHSHLEVGQPLVKTTNFKEYPVGVNLYGTKSQIEADVKAIRAAEPVWWERAIHPKKRAFVMVGGYSAGAQEAREWYDDIKNDPQYADVEFIHIQPQAVIPENFVAPFADAKAMYNQCLVYDGTNMADIQTALKDHEVLFVRGGSEMSIEAADQIGEALNAPMLNDTSCSDVRRNKYKMHERLKDRGLDHAEHCLSSDVNTILVFAKQQLQKNGHVVLKPVDSASSDNVKVCTTEEEVIRNFNLILQAKNRYGKQNTEVLAQEFLDGREFIVNFVVNDDTGTFFVADILEQNKVLINGTPNYRYEQPLSHDDPLFKEISAYVNNARSAHGVKFGPGHYEVIKTKDARLVLVEGASRLGGGMNKEECNNVFGHNPISLTIDAYRRPEVFAAHAAKPRKPLDKVLRNVFIISGMSGVIDKPFLSFDELKSKLPTLSCMDVHLDVGKKLKTTHNYADCPGFLGLYGTAEDVERDYQAWLRIEQKELSKVLRASVSLTSAAVTGLHAVSNMPTATAPEPVRCLFE